MKNNVFIICILLMISFSFCVEETQSFAEVVSLKGVVLWHKSNSFYWEEIELHTKLSPNDEIKTADESYCEIKFKEGHLLRMDPNSELTIQSATYDNQENVWKNIKITVGKIWVKLVKGVNEEEQFTIKTKFVSIPKQDALFAITAPAGKITSYEGQLKVVGNKQQMVIKQGYETVVDESGSIKKGTIASEQSQKEFNEFAKQTTIKKETMDGIRRKLQESIKTASANQFLQDEDQEVYYETEIKRTFIRKIMDTLNRK